MHDDYRVSYMIATDPAFARSKLAWLDPCILTSLLGNLNDADVVSLASTCHLLRDKWWRGRGVLSKTYRARMHGVLRYMKALREASARQVVEDEEDNDYLLGLRIPMEPKPQVDFVMGIWTDPEAFVFFQMLRMNEHLFHNTSPTAQATQGPSPPPLGASPIGKAWDATRGGWVAASGEYRPYLKGRGFVPNPVALLRALARDTGIRMQDYAGMTMRDLLAYFFDIHGLPVERMMRRGDPALKHVSRVAVDPFPACVT